MTSNDRLDLADAILQGVSADPELFLTRLDLLAPCTMIEDLFIERGEDGRPRYTPMGDAHRHLLESYAALIGRHAASLQEDARRLDPRHRVYSPLGIVYGFCADILSNMALDTLLSQPSFGLSLEDMFASRGSLENKRARAEGWKARQEREGARNPVDYSADWAAQMFDRTMSALRARAGHKDRANASDVPDARLFVESAPEGTRAGAGALRHVGPPARAGDRRDRVPEGTDSSATGTKDGSSRAPRRMENGSGSRRSC